MYTSEYIYNIKEINDLILDYKKHIEWSKYIIVDETGNISWDRISMDQIIHDFEFVDYYFPKIKPSNIIIFQKIPEWFIKKYFYKLDQKLLCSFQEMSCEFMDKYIGYMNMILISKSQKFENWFSEKYNNVLDWKALSRQEYLEPYIIEKYLHKCDLQLISIFNKKLTMDFIERHIEKLDLVFVLENNKVDDNFIIKYQDKVNWYVVSRRHVFSLAMLKRFEDKVNWLWIARYQKHIDKQTLLKMVPLKYYKMINDILNNK